VLLWRFPRLLLESQKAKVPGFARFGFLRRALNNGEYEAVCVTAPWIFRFPQIRGKALTSSWKRNSSFNIVHRSLQAGTRSVGQPFQFFYSCRVVSDGQLEGSSRGENNITPVLNDRRGAFI
jgi:hypothetical protein